MNEIVDALLKSGAEVDIKIKGHVAVRITGDGKNISVDILKPNLIGEIFKGEK
ncbi:MAG: hypothetical protein ABH829_04700 [archaeon]